MERANPAAAPGHRQAVDQAEIADYVAEITAGLAEMARNQGLQTLAFILEMARLEAENNRQGLRRGR